MVLPLFNMKFSRFEIFSHENSEILKEMFQWSLSQMRFIEPTAGIK